MGSRIAKDALFDGFASVAKAMSNGRRAELVDVLAQGERHVDELASEIGQSVANTSHHLQTLAAAGLVVTRREKTRIYYRLASTEVERLWSQMRSVAEGHLDQIDSLVEDYVGDRSSLEEVGLEELAARLGEDQLVVIDVRPTREYEAGHIVGAVSVPIDEVAAWIDELPADVEVVAYCRGRYCVFADDAVRLFKKRERNARRLSDGFPEWSEAGLPITTTGDTGEHS